MKKYLMMGAAALMFGFVAVSCSNEVYNPDAEQDAITWKYAKAFEKAFGTPDPHHTWGFGSSTRATRAITVNGDVYDKFPSAEQIAANFPTAIPEDAMTDEEIEAEWKGKNAVDENGNEIIADWGGKIQMWDLYAIYMNMVGKVINNIKVTTPGEYTVGHSWANPADRVYNVYINVGEGNSLTLKRNGAEHVNFYIMSGNITIDSNFGECGGIISVAEGVTVNDQRTHIAHNDGVKVFNKGTYNATNTTPYGSANTTTFDIGNFCTFYNEGKFTALGGLSYSPGDANDSYFMNLGDDAEVTAPSMTLNSTGNFFNSGKVTIAGETSVTQARLYWVNDGHYTTGSMTFSAKNTTFYNYCQLLVQGNAHMYDGEFNLMNGSYTEAATADFDNFIVNMYDGAGFNVKGDTDWGPQGDGTYQGFRTMNSGKGYVRLGGTATVAGHKNSLEITGNITYAINKTVDLGAGNSGVQPTIVFNEGTKAANFSKVTMAPKANDCGFTWEDDNDDEVYDGRIMCEDLNATDNSDFDFNDVVFDYKIEGNEAKIKLLAAGGTLPLTVGGVEVHKKFSVGPKDMVNTGAGPTKDPVTFTYTFPSNVSATAINIPIVVTKDGKGIELTAAEGKAASKIHVPTTTKWVREFKEIDKAYDKFKGWVLDENASWVSSIADYELIF